MNIKTENGNKYRIKQGEKATHRIASAISSKSWKWAILNLAWTVGPVTFVALQFGHYMGFGNKAPLENFYYFAGYTLIAGGFAIMASILHDAFYKPRIDYEKKQLLDAVDLLHLCITETRNYILQDMNSREREIMSAYYMLGSAGASAFEIETAIEILTSNSELAIAGRKSHIFAQHGMNICVEDIYQQIESLLSDTRQELYLNAPQVYELLDKRLRGITPSIRDGIIRGNGFIERVLNALEENDDSQMTFYDVMEVITLALELICGRYIAVLDARLKGDEIFEDAQEKLDEARHNYRIAIRKRNSRIRLLAESLYSEAQTDMSLVAEVTDATSRMITSIEKSLLQLKESTRNKYRKDYERIKRLNEQVAKHGDSLIKAEQKYHSKWIKYGKKMTIAMQKEDIKKSGFYIEERNIQLTDKQKLKLVHLINNISLQEDGKILKDNLRHAAIDIMNELDDMIDISQPEEQLAVENSNSADFGYITRGLAPQTKMEWAVIAIEAMHESRRRVAHRLAHNLILFYRLPLTESIISLFVDEFGADVEYLRELNDISSTAEPANSIIAPSKQIKIKDWNDLFANKNKKAS